jgi:hypothetical protein
MHSFLLLLLLLLVLGLTARRALGAFPAPANAVGTSPVLTLVTLPARRPLSPVNEWLKLLRSGREADDLPAEAVGKRSPSRHAKLSSRGCTTRPRRLYPVAGTCQSFPPAGPSVE